MMTGIDMCLLFITYDNININFINVLIYVCIYNFEQLIFNFLFFILNLGKHPFLSKNGVINHKKLANGEYEKIKEGKYSSTLVNLMERMIDVV
jgi:hypothetical protein